MTKMEKLAIAVALLECAFLGYFKYKATKVIFEGAERYLTEEAKRQAVRQRREWTANATESDTEEA